MGLDRNAKAFSNDILRVEISGPTQVSHRTFNSGLVGSLLAGGLPNDFVDAFA